MDFATAKEDILQRLSDGEITPLQAQSEMVALIKATWTRKSDADAKADAEALIAGEAGGTLAGGTTPGGDTLAGTTLAGETGDTARKRAFEQQEIRPGEVYQGYLAGRGYRGLAPSLQEYLENMAGDVYTRYGMALAPQLGESGTAEQIRSGFADWLKRGQATQGPIPGPAGTVTPEWNPFSASAGSLRNTLQNAYTSLSGGAPAEGTPEWDQYSGQRAYYSDPKRAYQAALQPGMANLPYGLMQSLYQKIRGQQYEDWQGQNPDQAGNFLSYAKSRGWF